MSLSMYLDKPKGYIKKFNIKRYIPDLKTSIKEAQELIAQAKKAPEIKINKHSLNKLTDRLSKITNPFDDASMDAEDEFEQGGQTDLGVDFGYGQFDSMREDLLERFGGKIVNRNDPLHEYYHCGRQTPKSIWHFVAGVEDNEGHLSYKECHNLYNLLKDTELKNPLNQRTLKQMLFALKQANDTHRGLMWC